MTSSPPLRRSAGTLAVAAIGGITTVWLDLGWVIWCACLALAALGLLLATPFVADRLRGVQVAAVWVAALVLAAAMVLVGVVAVRLQPLHGPGWALRASSAAVAGDTVVAIEGNRLVGRRFSSGTRRWAAVVDNYKSIEPIGDRLLLNGYRKLAAVDPETGKRLWEGPSGNAPRAVWLDTVVVDEPARGIDLRTGRTTWKRESTDEAGVFDVGGEFADEFRAALGRSAYGSAVLGYGDKEGYVALSAQDGRIARRLTSDERGDAGLLTLGNKLITASEIRGTMRVRGRSLGVDPPWNATVEGALDGADLGVVGGQLRVLTATDGAQSAVFLDPTSGFETRKPLPAGWRFEGELSPIVMGNPRQLQITDGTRHAIVDSVTGNRALESTRHLQTANSYTDDWSVWCRTVHDAVGGKHTAIYAVGPDGRTVGPVYNDGCGGDVVPRIVDRDVSESAALHAGGRLLGLPNVTP